MSAKIIDFNKSVYELCNEDSELTQIMEEIGFKDIIKPGMLNTAGRFMTIPKGAAMKKLELESIKQLFKDYGYEIKE